MKHDVSVYHKDCPPKLTAPKMIVDCNSHNLYLVPPLGVILLKFCQCIWPQKIRVPELSYGTVCMILDSAILANTDL